MTRKALPAPAGPLPLVELHTTAQIRTESPDWSREAMIYLFIDDSWYVCGRDDAVSCQGGSSTSSEVKRNEGISTVGCIVGTVLTVVLAAVGFFSFVFLGMIYYSEPWLGFLFFSLMTPAEISLVYFLLWALRPGSSKLTVALAIAFLITSVGFIIVLTPGYWIVVAIGTLVGVGSIVYLVKRRISQHPADEMEDYPPFKWEV